MKLSKSKKAFTRTRRVEGRAEIKNSGNRTQLTFQHCQTKNRSKEQKKDMLKRTLVETTEEVEKSWYKEEKQLVYRRNHPSH